jgi:hypothetical protein
MRHGAASLNTSVAGLGLSGQKKSRTTPLATTPIATHRLQNLYQPQQNGLLNRLPKKASFWFLGPQNTVLGQNALFNLCESRPGLFRKHLEYFA